MFLFVGLFCTGQINFPFVFDHVLFSNCSLVMSEFFDINAHNLSLTLCSSETSPLCSTATYSRALPCAFTAWPISGKLSMDRSPTERDPITSGGFTRAGCLTQGQAWWVFAHFSHSEATTEWIRHVFSQLSIQSPAGTTTYVCADDAQLLYIAKFVSVFIIKHPTKRLKAVLSIQLHKFYGAESAVGLFSSSSFPSTTPFVQNNQIYH